jgi:signal transduction histidine kinase
VAAALEVALNASSLTAAKEELELAKVAMTSISRMSSHLLAVSDIDQGHVKLLLAKINVADLVKEAVAGRKAEAKTRQVALELDIANDLPATYSDEALLKDILAQLLDNACLYSAPKTKAVIKLSQQNGQLLLEITTNGPAISEEELPLIFTKFFRGSNKPIDVPGSGLGLYIARGYAMLLGGKLWFSSAHDTTTFSLALPIKES